MQSPSFKQLILSAAVTSAMLAATPALATNYPITVSVAANFYATVNDIADAFATQFASNNPGDTVSFTITQGATGNLANAICQKINNNEEPTVDVFLAADDDRPAGLYNGYKYPATPGATNCSATGSSTYSGEASAPFTYAIGEVVLFAYDGSSVDATGGLPTTTYLGNTVPAQPTRIADPATAPYGQAAKEVLNNVYGIDIDVSSYNVTASGTIADAFNAIDNETVEAGFVAKSQVFDPALGDYDSDLGTFKEFVAGTDYDPIIQDGTILSRTRSPGAQGAVEDFVDYLLGDATALGIIEDYGYGLP